MICSILYSHPPEGVTLQDNGAEEMLVVRVHGGQTIAFAG